MPIGIIITSLSGILKVNYTCSCNWRDVNGIKHLACLTASSLCVLQGSIRLFGKRIL